MLVTSLPMETHSRRVQSLKAYCPIVVTPLGMVMPIKLEQPLKADPPMVFTLEGMNTDVRPLQSRKAFPEIPVTEYSWTLFVLVTVVAISKPPVGPSPKYAHTVTSLFTSLVMLYDSTSSSKVSPTLAHVVAGLSNIIYNTKSPKPFFNPLLEVNLFFIILIFLVIIVLLIPTPN